MKLLWKLLRQHVNIGQLAGFFLANLLGMLIVLLSLQFYEDVVPAFSGEDGLMKNTYLILSKRIAAVSAFGGEAQTFSEEDVRDLRNQSFVRKVGAFTASQYQVYASLSMGGVGMGTDMFFESVPDDFVDVKWSGQGGQAHQTQLLAGGEVPIILPRTYLALYNFGFAQTKNLPKLSEGIISMIQMDILLRGEGGREVRMKGRVVGFSTRLNTVLVPESFMRTANAELAPNATVQPTRLIVEVGNPADDAIVAYVQERGYELEDNSLDAGRATYFLKVTATVVLAVGLLISILSFYILMLSVFLLVQKNAQKLQTLLLIGYSRARVALPYQLLTAGLNAGVLLFSIALLFWIRGWYMQRLWEMFPALSEGSVNRTLLLGLALCCFVSFMNALAIRRKISSIARPR